MICGASSRRKLVGAVGFKKIAQRMARSTYAR